MLWCISFRKTLPSSFLLKQAAKNRQRKKGKDFVYDRDILCLPKSYATSSGIPIPRSKSVREMLGRNGLMGKIRLSSSLSEEMIMDEI